MEEIVASLRERAKELSCLYRVDDLLNRQETPKDQILQEVVEALPPGWQYPEICQARLNLEGEVYQTSDIERTPRFMKADILIEGEPVGELEVFYTEEKPPAHEGPFLKEEGRLINTIAERIAYFLFQRRLTRARARWEHAVESISSRERPWVVIRDFLRQTDPKLLVRITRKMINHLFWSGVAQAQELLQEFAPGTGVMRVEIPDENRPLQRADLGALEALADKTFEIAADHLSEDELVTRIQTWIKEDKTSSLLDAVSVLNTPLGELIEAIGRFKTSSVNEAELPGSLRTELKVGLIRRFFAEQLDYINVAKDFTETRDFYGLVSRILGSPESKGKLGGKSAGIFLASRIIEKSLPEVSLLNGLKFPATWHIASDAMLDFIRNNDLNDVYSTKYRDISQVRLDYPHTIQVFKNSHFPSEIVSGLSAVLDEIESRPIIVRSSSLLEDRSGAAFSGKYKSLFLANQGSKRECLEALKDAIAEIYASIFNPDVIEYRAEKGLLDVHEEMAILIQEVVGSKVGRYYLPSFSGVAFSNNEFRWSARIKREDGLLRLVPGLGTRAVDRLTDDYPILIAPGQPGLRANVTLDEIVRYSPKKIDVINVETKEFETIDVLVLLRQYGEDYPAVRQLVSIAERDHIRKPSGLGPDFENDELVVNFEGLIADTPFVAQMRALLQMLQKSLGRPVDVEFASDGSDLYLLQCRPQSYTADAFPAPIPRNLSREKMLFSANRFITNGQVSNITHIVYVDPDAYNQIDDLNRLKDVGRAVGKLNKLLPKRKFILMGPGRWGSRGDIKLGVSVTYGDINNTALLVEIARKKGNYVPELSFGTHFFQDLVESGIRYLPLYPDQEGIFFNELFFRRSHNVLSELAPDLSRLSETVRVIDVTRERPDQVCHVLMNSDLDEAVGLLGRPAETMETAQQIAATAEPTPEDHWRWRLRMAESLASELDQARFGVKAVYLFGGVKNAIAGPGSDIDLIVHFAGDAEQRRELASWLEGWSLSLAEINYLRTGYRTDGLLDVHWITDEDVAQQTSFAAKINAVTDAARPLPMKKP
jgi:hypothetical protein